MYQVSSIYAGYVLGHLQYVPSMYQVPICTEAPSQRVYSSQRDALVIFSAVEQYSVYSISTYILAEALSTWYC